MGIVHWARAFFTVDARQLTRLHYNDMLIILLFRFIVLGFCLRTAILLITGRHWPWFFILPTFQSSNPILLVFLSTIILGLVAVTYTATVTFSFLGAITLKYFGVLDDITDIIFGIFCMIILMGQGLIWKISGNGSGK